MAGRRTRFARTPFSSAGLADNTITVWSRGALKAIAGGPTVSSDGTFAFSRKYVAVNTTPYAVTASDYIIGVNTTSTVVTLNLPAAAVANKGRVIIVKDEGANAEARNITVAASSGQTIDGASTAVLNVARASIHLYSSGAAWFII